MRGSVTLAITLWLLLAVVVFNVTFDWQTRVSGVKFVQAQLVRQQQGQPPISLNDGFRPMVSAAARQSAVWLAVIALAGISATATASKISR